MTASESETIIRFDETDRLAISPRVANMLKRRGLKPDEVTVSPKWVLVIAFKRLGKGGGK